MAGTGKAFRRVGLRRLPAALALIAALIAAPSAQAANTLVVDDDSAGTAANCNAPNAAFTTLSGAIAAASNGDIIQVCPGTYASQAVVNKALTLRGARAGVDARDPSRTGLPATESVLTGTGNSGITPLRVIVDNVSVDGFTIEGNTNVGNLAAGVLVNPNLAGLDFRNNIVQNNISGLQLANDTVTNPAIIRNNVFRNNNQPGSVASGAGIYSDQLVSGGLLTNVTIADNAFSGNNTAGVLLGSTAAASQSGVSVSGNTMTTNGNAILLYNTASVTIANNSISAGTASQIVVGGGVNGAAITGNLIQNGATRGIRIGDFGGGGTNQAISLSCNAFGGNPAAGLEIDAPAGSYTGSLNAELNWWGAASGPTIASNPGGTGDKIVDSAAHVDYTPFLLSGLDSQPAAAGFDCLPTVSVPDATAAEESGVAVVTVTLNKPHPVAVSASYATADGAATSPQDYASTSGTVSFAAGETSQTISVPVVNDADKEADESFGVTLSSPVNASITDGSGSVTIADDESRAPPNGAPVANGDSFKAEEAQKLKVRAPGVLKNDSDPDGDALSASLVTQAKHGTVKLKTSGAFKYKPEAGFTGKDRFTYEATDPAGTTARAKVKLKVKG
jgi:hypothetical protein